MKIEEIWAYVYQEASGDEGIPAMLLEKKPFSEVESAADLPTWLPMIGADRARVESLRPYAQNIANSTGQTLRLMRFSFGQVMEEIAPEEQVE